MILSWEENCWAFQKGLSVERNLVRGREAERQEGPLGSSYSRLSELLSSSLTDYLVQTRGAFVFAL